MIHLIKMCFILPQIAQLLQPVEDLVFFSYSVSSTHVQFQCAHAAIAAVSGPTLEIISFKNMLSLPELKLSGFFFLLSSNPI